MSYQMIILDLDDTLLGNDHSISERNKQALMKVQEQGDKVVLASGRPTYGMVPFAKELSLAEYGSFILSFNGGKIINCQTNEEFFSQTLSIDAVSRLEEISKRENVQIHTYVGEEIVTAEANRYTSIESDLTGLPIKLVDSFMDGVTEPVVKVLMVGEPEHLQAVEKKLQDELGDEFSVMRSKPFFLEFTAKGITKGTSIEKLIDELGIKREEVIAMGDSYNDQEMIEFAGLGVAMGNAPEDIKEIADFVADTNVNDGVAQVVEKFLLKENSTYK
ncbi:MULTISPECIES: Cof-type HAD-IIB family hydrolase [Pontibacillus]|uniref:Cof-type HAD-IIB family hydrolase n=1 Tax=Pontibacillus chungwhensis TaxID=265426 RepID=A0ABY8UYP4_9BACI|nr:MULTISPECIES: Cof-type HAD-IIB family hydrolase [Pontibacillus]MCD5325392.1 Cof-type HAD-IIB family hydrolase [Pontibacillus sp. HN14]WIF98508.1 Cof-type HAD-IIB family hydrolase [Pontibacillus chungwhensis]